jgi:hypothetical protein
LIFLHFKTYPPFSIKNYLTFDSIKNIKFPILKILTTFFYSILFLPFSLFFFNIIFIYYFIFLPLPSLSFSFLQLVDLLLHHPTLDLPPFNGWWRSSSTTTTVIFERQILFWDKKFWFWWKFLIWVYVFWLCFEA